MSVIPLNNINNKKKKDNKPTTTLLLFLLFIDSPKFTKQDDHLSQFYKVLPVDFKNMLMAGLGKKKSISPVIVKNEMNVLWKQISILIDINQQIKCHTSAGQKCQFPSEKEGGEIILNQQKCQAYQLILSLGERYEITSSLWSCHIL